MDFRAQFPGIRMSLLPKIDACRKRRRVSVQRQRRFQSGLSSDRPKQAERISIVCAPDRRTIPSAAPVKGDEIATIVSSVWVKRIGSRE